MDGSSHNVAVHTETRSEVKNRELDVIKAAVERVSLIYLNIRGNIYKCKMDIKVKENKIKALNLWYKLLITLKDGTRNRSLFFQNQYFQIPKHKKWRKHEQECEAFLRKNLIYKESSQSLFHHWLKNLT